MNIQYWSFLPAVWSLIISLLPKDLNNISSWSVGITQNCWETSKRVLELRFVGSIFIVRNVRPHTLGAHYLSALACWVRQAANRTHLFCRTKGADFEQTGHASRAGSVSERFKNTRPLIYILHFTLDYCWNRYSKIWWDTSWHINRYKQINVTLFRQRVTAGSATDL